VHVRRVLHYQHVFALYAGETQFSNGGCGVFHQSTFVFRVTPRSGDNLCAVSGADFVLVGVNQFIQCRRVDQSFFL
jgi:hypothetical protein